MKSSQKGIALLLALILLLILSVTAVSLMFLAQTETWSSLNYRLMSQARDGAEAGLNATSNYLVNTYTPPASSGTDLITNYSTGFSPNCGGATGNAACVIANSSPVVLSANFAGHTANYPVAAVKTAFTSAGAGSITSGIMTVNYTSYAELLSQYQFTPFGTTAKSTIQTWRITSDGTITGTRNAIEEVTAILEREKIPVVNYAAFATSCADGALDFSGGANTDSYDSSTLGGGGGAPHTDNKDGNVGTNGSLNANGNPTSLYGSLSTPRNGVGGTSSCLTGAQAVLTGAANQLKGGVVELPQVVNYPTPAVPSPLPGMGTQTLNGTCGSVTGCDTMQQGANNVMLCPSSAATSSCTPSSYADLNISGSNTTVTIGAVDNGKNGVNKRAATCTAAAPCIYNINSLALTGNATLQVLGGPIILNIAGCSANNGTACTSSIAAPLDLTGGSLANGTYVSGNFQILYAGTGTIKLTGSNSTSGVVYAPNSQIQLNSNNGHWYGALIGSTVSASGGVTIDYDRNLAKTAFTVGNWMLTKFNWKKN
jgi:Tfp pilus assembly protein PilX